MPNRERIDALSKRLDDLLKSNEGFRREIDFIRASLDELRAESIAEEIPVEQPVEIIPEPMLQPVFAYTDQAQEEPFMQPTFAETESKFSAPVKYNLEKFIGENLINKIGIIITVIGVAIGAKYSIDHDLVSPLTRIVFGYLTGLGLLGVAIKLKPKYENFSAVLLSGAMANLYFITFAAYSFYNLIPQSVTFGLMVAFTAFTVVAAINYNRQIIALFGLVGAYAVPFLLSDGSGRVHVLFTYMAIINAGILILSFKKYWKQLFYSAFALTWLVFLGWYFTKYDVELHFSLALFFSTVFFAIFYVTSLAYKVVKKEKFLVDDILMLLVNSFLYFGLGYALLHAHNTGKEFLGLFALSNALIHFAACTVVYRTKLADRNLFYLVSGLVLVFLTMAVPIQLDGNWVTLLWSAEAVVLFWIGRTKNASIYEWLSYPVMVIAFVSLLQDYSVGYIAYNTDHQRIAITPLLNMNFFTSLFFMASFSLVNWIHFNKNYTIPVRDKEVSKLVYFGIPTLLLLSVFLAFQAEISAYWDYKYFASLVKDPKDYLLHDTDLQQFKYVWMINFTMLFISVLTFINKLKIKSEQLAQISLAIGALTLFAFLAQGLFAISELRVSYVNQDVGQYYSHGIFNILIRYISLAFAGGLLYSIYQNAKANFHIPEVKIGFDIVLHIAFVWILTSEMIHWMNLAGFEETYKLGISIFWGIYSLFLIVVGIRNKAKHLRIGAMSLFGVTLLKLFLYDIAHLNTISKAVVLVSLGILLLIISFLYNKFKDSIFDEQTA
ncbi:MAG: DUF2339 domain-containing protein [Bacteroidia bacterium]